MPFLISTKDTGIYFIKSTEYQAQMPSIHHALNHLLPSPFPFAVSEEAVHLILPKAGFQHLRLKMISHFTWDDLTLLFFLLFLSLSVFSSLPYIKTWWATNKSEKWKKKKPYIGSNYQFIFLFSVKYKFQERNHLNCSTSASSVYSCSHYTQVPLQGFPIC